MLALAAAALTAMAGASTAAAQTFPDKPLTLVVGFPPGGSFDTIMRVVAEEMAKNLGQPVTVDNRPGAGGAIATTYVVGARPDGYTLLAAGLQLTTGPHLNKVSYNPATDLTMIGQLGTIPVLLLVKADSPIRSAADIVALAKARGGSVNIGTGGIGTTGHFGTLLTGNALNVDATHVPFKGGAAALQALAAGDVDLVFDQQSGVMQGLIQGGKVRVVAVMQGKRVPSLPEVKTAAEFGLALEGPLQGWQGLAVRAQTPAPILHRLTVAWDAAAASPAVKSRAEQLGIEVTAGLSPQSVQQHYLAELNRWGAFIRKHQITAQ
jgi:tripartite-type tricarboxylate transporter receptor subunit TctC